MFKLKGRSKLVLIDKTFIWGLILLSFFQLVNSQTEVNHFSYSLSGDLEWTVYDETPDAVAGAFYEFRENQTDVIYVILGIKGDNDNALSQKLRFAIPIPLDEYFEQIGDSLVPIKNRPRARFWAENTDYTIDTGKLSLSTYTPTLKLDPFFREERLKGEFEYSFRESLCIRGNFSVTLNEEARKLDLFVDPKKSISSDPTTYISKETEELIKLEREAYFRLSTLEKRMAEAGAIYWNGHTYLLPSPLAGASVTQKSNENEVFNACN